MSSRVNIGGVEIDRVDLAQAVERCQGFLNEKGARHITTPNPEIILQAQVDPKLKAVLNGSDLAIPDGWGLVWATDYLANKTGFWYGLIKLAINKKGFDLISERVAGVDLAHKLIEMGVKQGERVVLVGLKGGLDDQAVDKAVAKLCQQYPGGDIAGVIIDPDAEEDIGRVEALRPEIMLVGLGAPRQDLWIAENKDRFDGLKVAIGCGATIDFIAGVQHRAPQWMRQVGLEWLWRIVRQPSRWRRIYQAVVVFPREVRKWR